MLHVYLNCLIGALLLSDYKLTGRVKTPDNARNNYRFYIVIDTQVEI